MKVVVVVEVVVEEGGVGGGGECGGEHCDVRVCVFGCLLWFVGC